MSDVSQSLLSSDPARQERLEAVLADYLRRVEAGDSVDRQAILAEHADLADDLQEFFGNQERFQRIVGQPSWQGLAATADQQPSERLGTQIGPYKLLQEIGEGGMGVVYMAEQREPLQRRVALKIIKPGMDSREVIARFEAERQALAMMDHPGIAKVLDAGTTDGGRPFFVMELVKGIPITKYCDERQLTLRERLELMVPVCQAVQHAHQKGIVHRDIKPTNVLVAQYDGRPAPKVIDFGVAKAIAQKLTERTMFTQFGQVVGTLEYMSPEQAELNQLDIDTRSDIYSLGVLLYELLTGSTPFDRKRLRTAAFDEVLRIIREEEPPKPSTRISSSETLPSIAASRRAEPVRLGRMVRGELDWIVMKALDKDRTRRYETANGLAMDIQRFLADEPVSACPPSAGYQLRKLIRRHKRGLVIAGLLAALLLILAVGLPVEMLLRWERDAALLQKSRAEQAEKRAHAAEAEAKIRSHLARSADYRQRGQMGQRFKALDEIKQALRLDPSTELRNELRNEAIACLALADVRVAKEWDGFPRGSVYCAFDDALERYARTETSGAVTVRRVADDKEIYPIAAVNSGEPWPTLSPDGRYLAVNHYGDAQLKIWKLSGQVPAIVVERSNVRTGQFSPDSCRHATLNTDGTITLFDLTSGEQRKLAGSYRDASLIRFDPQGKRLAVACRTCVQVLDLSTESVAANFPLPPDYFPSVSWHPDGNTLATIGGDRVITIYDVASGKQTARLKGCKNGGLDCLFNHAGDMLLSHGWEQMLRLWDPRSGRQLLQTPALLDFPRFSTDDRFIAGERNGTRLRLLEVAKGNELHILTRAPVADDKIKDFLIGAVSPDGRLFACGMDDGVRLWDLVDGHQLALLPIGNTAGVAFEESESSAALLTNSRAGLFRWPIDADPALGVIRLGPRQTLPVAGGDNQIAASHNGAVTGVARYSEVAIVHRDRPDKLVRLAPVEDARYVAVSSSGRWVAAGSHGPGGAKVWDAHTGKLERDLPVGGLCRVAFSGDEKWLATASWTGCRLWRVGSWEEGPRIDGRCPCFSPDGRMLAVETGEGDVRLVDPETGRQYARLTNPHRDRANDICFSPDGSKLLTSSVDGDCVHVWDLRMIRKELAELSLDWDLPAYPPAKEQTKQKPLRVEVLSAAPAR